MVFRPPRTKAAACDRFREAVGARPNVDTSRPDIRLDAFLDHQNVTLYLDTSGEALFKRGLRAAATEAPLRENLAAGILRVTGAVAFEKLHTFDSREWRALCEAGRARQTPRAPLAIYGSDIHGGALTAARANLEAAGLADAVALKQADVLDMKPPAGEGMLVTNPPYGVRLGEEEHLAAFYPRLGESLKRNFAGRRAR